MAALPGLAFLLACGGEGPEPEPAPSPTAIPRREAQIYAQTCQWCHGDQEGVGGRPDSPPHNQRGHTWHHPDAQLLDWVLNGKPFTAMPGFTGILTQQDAEAVLAYVKTWWTEEQRRAQADVSRRYQEALDRQAEASKDQRQ